VLRGFVDYLLCRPFIGTLAHAMILPSRCSKASGLTGLRPLGIAVLRPKQYSPSSSKV
jgi:hypothetical protein